MGVYVVQQEKPKPVPVLLSYRYALAYTTFFATTCLFTMRFNISMAIVCMVKKNGTNVSTQAEMMTSSQDDECNRTVTQTQGRGGEFVWTRSTQGLILSSFFWGYLFTQILGGWLSTRFGSKWVIYIAMILNIIPNTLIPVMARIGENGCPGCIVALRVIMGLSQGVYFPAISCLWSVWAPVYERTKLSSISVAGAVLGNILSMAVSGVVCQHWGWPSVFYLFSLMSVPWFFVWPFLAYSTPALHPRISEHEKTYIESNVGNTAKIPPIPWLGLWTSVPVWTIFVCVTLAQVALHTITTMGPMYNTDVLKFNIQNTGIASAIPALMALAGMLFWGFLIDTIRQKKILSTTVTRKLSTLIGLGSAIIIGLIVSELDCPTRYIAIAMFCLISALGPAMRAGLRTNHLDIAGRFAGVVMGIENTFATVSGIVAPLMVSALTPKRTHAQWKNVFYVITVLNATALIGFLVFGRGELQGWANVGDKDLGPTHIVDDNTTKETKHNEDSENNTFPKSDDKQPPTVTLRLTNYKTSENM